MRRLTLHPGRPAGRLFYCLISVLVAVGVSRGAPPPPTPPATTTISDVIYRADGSTAAGTLLITWPAFTTADQHAVPAGSMSVAIGPFGAINLALAPNQDATPAGTYYKVVMKLNDGTTSEEFWVVPTLSPTTISAIRSQVVPAGVALQVVTRQYVDDQLAAASANQNNYVLKSGDTMTGMLTSPGLVSAKLNNVRYANQFGSVQAAIDDLPACAFTHCGVVIVPQGTTWSPAATTLGTGTALWDYATDSRFPQLWMGNGGEFRLMGSGAAQAGSLVLNNTATGGDRASSIVFRTGPSTALRNIWQLRSGNYGNATAGVNADDLLLLGWQGSTYTTGTLTTITNGSTAVVGSGTNWTSALVGGNFLINAQPTVGATVLSVQDATHLTLASNWSGTTAGPAEAYTITGGSTGTQRSRLFVGQNGVWLLNPSTTDFDPLAEATANRVLVLSAPTNVGWATMWARLNNFQATGNTGLELRSSNSDAKRKFLALNDTANEFRVLAADGSTVLTQLTDAGNYRVNGKIGIGKAPSAYLDVQAADLSNPILIYRTGGSIATHNASINSGGNGAFAVNDNTGATKVNLSSTGTSTFSLGLIASTVNATSGFQINGSALAFSNLSGAATSGQLPATVVYTGQSNTYSAGTQDFESAAVTRPFRRLAFASFPGSCTANQEFLERSDPATAGQVIYVCNSTGDGWDLVGAGSGASAGGNNTEIQYNNSDSLGGIDNGASGDCLTSNGAGVTPSFQPCGAGGGANAALSNLAGVSINASLAPQATLDLGDSTHPWEFLYLYGAGTYGANNQKITSTAPTAARTFTLPDADSNPVQPFAGASNEFVTAISSAGVISHAQPAFSNLSGTATAGQVPNLENLNGTLTAAQGGTGAAPAGDDQVLVASSSSAAAWKTVNDCQGAGKALTYTQSSNAFGCNTVSGGSPYASGGSTANTIPKSNGATQLLDSTLVDNGTSLTTTLEHMTLGAGEDTTAGLGIYPAAGLTSTDQYGIALGPTYTSAATSSGNDLAIFGFTADAAFTMTDHYALNIADITLGTGAAVTNNYGIYVGGITAGSTNNYSIFTAGGLVAHQANNIQTTATDVLKLWNNNASTSGVTVQYSPALHWTGHAWNTGGTPADNATDIRAYVRPTSGNPPTFDWVLRKSINGGAYSDIFAVNDSSVATATIFDGTTGFRVNGGAASGNVLRGDGTNFVSATLACADVTNCPSLAASGTAGVGPSEAGTASTAARSDHDHRSFHTLTWYFPGTPSTGVSPMILAVPQGIVNGTITGMQVTVATTSASASTFNLQRCTAGCTGTSPTFSNIYSSDNTLVANTSEADFGATNLTTTLNAKDQFKANLVSIGSGLANITITLTYKYDTTN